MSKRVKFKLVKMVLFCCYSAVYSNEFEVFFSRLPLFDIVRESVQ